MDENAAEFLKKGDDSVVYWLISIFGECMDHGKVPQDWQNACTVPLYKSKGTKVNVQMTEV